MCKFTSAIAFYLLYCCICTPISAESREIRIPVKKVDTFPILQPPDLDTSLKSNPNGLVRVKPVTPQFTLVLSGGGLKGLAHIGVLQSLTEAGLVPYGIAAVSSGSLIGGLYAGGFTTDEILHRLRLLEPASLMLDKPERRSMLLARKQDLSRHIIELRLSDDLTPILPGAISPGQRLYQRLLELTSDLPYRFVSDWSELPTKILIQATDLCTGTGVVFKNGDMTPAIRSSMTVPLLFDPFVIDTLKLIDGGITSNIPVDLAREMLDGVVVAVDVSAELNRFKTPPQPWQIVDQVTTILERETNRKSRAEADILVIPNIINSPEASEDYFQVIQAGRDAMDDLLQDLRELLESQEDEKDQTSFYIKHVLVQDVPGYEYTVPESWTNVDVEILEIKRFLVELLNSGEVEHCWAEYIEESQSLLLKIEQTPILNEVVFKGNLSIVDSLLHLSFSDQIGNRLNYDQIKVGVDNILRIYRSSGYAVAGIKSANLNRNSGILTLAIDEGNLCCVEFKGLKKVPLGAITREVPLKESEPVNSYAIQKATSALYNTGLFRNINPELVYDPEGSGKWHVVFHVQEHISPPIRLGLAYQSQHRTRGFGELTWPGPFNYAGRLIFYTSVGEIDTEHRIAYKMEMGNELSVLHNFIFGYSRQYRYPYDQDHERLRGERFEESRWGGLIEVGAQAESWGLLAFTARMESHDNYYETETEHYQLSAIGLKLGLDNLDRFPYPNEGIQLKSKFETSGKFIGSDVDFYKFTSSIETYYQLIPRYTVGMRFIGRTADRTTPRDERFRLGGIHEFPGLNLDEKEGIIQMTGGIDLRFDLLSRALSDTYIGIRSDIGGSWSDPAAQIVKDDWMRSVAVYIALDTVLGPIHLQWGHLFPSATVRKQDIIFIQAGSTF